MVSLHPCIPHFVFREKAPHSIIDDDGPSKMMMVMSKKNDKKNDDGDVDDNDDSALHHHHRHYRLFFSFFFFFSHSIIIIVTIVIVVVVITIIIFFRMFSVTMTQHCYSLLYNLRLSTLARLGRTSRSLIRPLLPLVCASNSYTHLWQCLSRVIRSQYLLHSSSRVYLSRVLREVPPPSDLPPLHSPRP